MSWLKVAFGAAVLVGCLASQVVAAPPAAPVEPKNFSCTFAKGTSWSYGPAGYKSGQPVAFAFDISEIDLEGQAAKLVIPGTPTPKTGPLRIIRALNANHFLEVANEGFLNLTTVYDKDIRTGAHPAVHSRHLGVLGEPVFSQYAGLCSAK